MPPDSNQTLAYLPSKKGNEQMKYIFTIGMDVRAYGTVMIEADTPEQAEKLLTAERVENDFVPAADTDFISCDFPINISVLDGQFEDEQNNTHTMAGCMDIKNGSWVARPERDDLKVIVDDLAKFTTPEQEFEENGHKQNYPDVESFIADFGSDRLFDEYMAFMTVVNRAQALLKESAQ